MTFGRTRLVAAACVAALSASVLVAVPTFGDQSIRSVRARVATLYHQAEMASEHYNAARGRLHQSRVRLDAARSDLAREQAMVAKLRQQVAQAVVAQYQGQSLSSVRVLFSGNPDSFLGQMATLSQYSYQRDQLMRVFTVRTQQLSMRRAAAQQDLARVTTTEHRMAAEKAKIDAKLQDARNLLQRLKTKAAAEAAARAAAAARAQRASRSAARQPTTSTASAPSQSAPARQTSSTSVPAGVSGKARIAVNYAMAHVGDAYVYGAAGPTAFDCSGLTMMAWRAAGVSLPHNAAEQMGYGTPVSESALQPGDLVFYYSPVSHVGMYIGHGKIVNAENPSVGVVVAPVNLMPYAGAVRIG